MSAVTDAIARYKAAWEAYQIAPDGDDTMQAGDDEAAALAAALMTSPADMRDVIALKAFLDWYVVEEASVAKPDDLTNLSNWPFAAHAALSIALNGREAAMALVKSIEHDNNGSIVGGQYMGGNGGLLSLDTIRAADAVRKLMGSK